MSLFESLSLTKIYFGVLIILIALSLFYIQTRDPVTVYMLSGEKPKEFNISQVETEDLASKKFYVDIKIPNKTDVRVSVLDTTGQIIKTLIDEKNYTPGLYRIRWNLKNSEAGRYKCQ